ncbi:MAG TPA: hypothetical protein VMV95_02385 [Bacillota bacterium]|nr:hypothetical protein [Bacillota bacterium]
MKIILKYYDNKGNLKIIKSKSEVTPIDSIIRFKILKNNEEWPCCDFYGKCTNKAYAEVYLFLMKKGKKGWNYLCKKHYYEEQKRLEWKLPSCLSVEW